MAESSDSSGQIKRALVIFVVLLLLVLAALAVTVWQADPEAPLPFDYDGF